MTSTEKINNLTRFLKRFDIENNFCIKTDEICGKTFALATIKENSVNVHSNFMTYKEMNCYFFGMMHIKNNKINF